MWIIIVHGHVPVCSSRVSGRAADETTDVLPLGSPPWPGLGHQSVPGQSIVWCGGDKSKDGWGVHQYHHPRTVGTDQPREGRCCQATKGTQHPLQQHMESHPSTYQQPGPLASTQWSVWPSIDLLPKVASKITAQRTEPISAAVTNWTKLRIKKKSLVVISPRPSKCLLASV